MTPPDTPPSVLVVGTVAFDLVGTVTRFPSPGEAARLDSMTGQPGGCAGNVARQLAGLGVAPRLLSSVGPDFAGSDYEKALTTAGVDLSGVVRSDKPTARAAIFTDGASKQLIFYHSGASDDMTRLPPTPAPLAHFAPGELSAYPRLMEACGKVTFDPGQETHYRSADVIKACIEGCDILFANVNELRRVARKIGSVQRLIKQGLTAVVETLGREGCNLHTEAGGVYVPSPVVKAVDPTGAGDAHRAGFLTAYLRGWELVECVRMGNVVASYVVEAFGAQGRVVAWTDAGKRYRSAYGKALPRSRPPA